MEEIQARDMVVLQTGRHSRLEPAAVVRTVLTKNSYEFFETEAYSLNWQENLENVVEQVDWELVASSFNKGTVKVCHLGAS